LVVTNIHQRKAEVVGEKEGEGTTSAEVEAVSLHKGKRRESQTGKKKKGHLFSTVSTGEDRHEE